MTDLETMMSMFNRAGVLFSREDHLDKRITTLTLTEGDGPKNLGYSGFIVDLEFNEAGELQTVGAWE